MSCVGLCSCVSYTVNQVLVCVIVSLKLCVKCWPVFLCRIHCASRFCLCLCVSYTVCQGLICVLVSLTLCVKVWSVFVCLLHCVSRFGLR